MLSTRQAVLREPHFPRLHCRHLSGNGLTGSLPASWGALSDLTWMCVPMPRSLLRSICCPTTAASTSSLQMIAHVLAHVLQGSQQQQPDRHPACIMERSQQHAEHVGASARRGSSSGAAWLYSGTAFLALTTCMFTVPTCAHVTAGISTETA
jgi:hypothetical protein